MRQALATILLLGMPRAALACPVCFGENDSQMGAAVKAGVIFMLVLVAAVLGGFASFIVHLNRRARQAADTESGRRWPWAEKGTA
jgi:hypothetical protein